jgi:hypothetical protein
MPVLQDTGAGKPESVMSAGSREELSGFLEVKVPSRVRRRRGLAPWKVRQSSYIAVRRFVLHPDPDDGRQVYWPCKAYRSRDAPTVQHQTAVRSAHTVFMCFVFI